LQLLTLNFRNYLLYTTIQDALRNPNHIIALMPLEKQGEKMNLYQRVEELTVAYGGGSRKAIGEFILREWSRLYRYSIQEIAEKTYTSKAALVRFAKELGFSGWREFLKAFVREEQYESAHYTDIDPNYPFTEQSSEQDVVRQICSLQVESILDTADLLSGAPLEQAVTLLQRAERVGLFGVNPNNLLGELFARKLLTIGKPVDIAAQGVFGLLASALRPTDCALIISYSGNTALREPEIVLPILPSFSKKAPASKAGMNCVPDFGLTNE